VVSVTLRPLFTPGKDPVPIVQEARWAPGPVRTGAENLASHWYSIPGPIPTELPGPLSFDGIVGYFDAGLIYVSLKR